MLYEDVLLLGKDIKGQRRTTHEELKSMHDFPACPFNCHVSGAHHIIVGKITAC